MKLSNITEFVLGRHISPILQVSWLSAQDPHSENSERLISIASDGKILEWHMEKEMTFKSLMVLKRIGNDNGVMNQYASGLCFDFPTKDLQIYLAGSDDGTIYRCSCSYNDQHLDATASTNFRKGFHDYCF